MAITRALCLLLAASAAWGLEAPENDASEVIRGLEFTAPPELIKISEQWRTQRQLEKLSKAPGPVFSFAVIGDAEVGRFFWSRWLFNRKGKGAFWKQLRRIDAQDPEFVIQLGDMVSRGKPKSYQAFFKHLNKTGIDDPYLTVIGNHDRDDPHPPADAGIYPKVFGDEDYFFDLGGVRFVALDTSEMKVTLEQIDWLERVLDTPNRKVVFTHMPAVQLKPWSWGGGGFSQGSGEFLACMSRNKVDRVYMGHVHGFGTLDYRGVRYVLSAGGGSPMFPSGAPAKFHHYISVQVTPEGLSETVHPLKGESFPILWDDALVVR